MKVVIIACHYCKNNLHIICNYVLFIRNKVNQSINQSIYPVLLVCPFLVVEEVSPQLGSYAGGTRITVKGKFFDTLDTQVMINGK